MIFSEKDVNIPLASNCMYNMYIFRSYVGSVTTERCILRSSYVCIIKNSYLSIFSTTCSTCRFWRHLLIYYDISEHLLYCICLDKGSRQYYLNNKCIYWVHYYCQYCMELSVCLKIYVDDQASTMALELCRIIDYSHVI